MAFSAEVDERVPSDVPAPPRRPRGVTVAGVVLAVIAVIVLLSAVGQLTLYLGRGYSTEVLLMQVVQPVIMRVLVALGAGSAAALVFVGRDIGRALAFAISGIVCWLGLSSALFWVIEQYDGGRHWTAIDYVPFFASIAVAALGVAVILPLSQGRSVDWFSQLRQRRTGRHEVT